MRLRSSLKDDGDGAFAFDFGVVVGTDGKDDAAEAELEVSAGFA